MKILITTDWYTPVINGVVTSVINLEKELRERGNEVKILTLSLDGKSHYNNNVYYMKSYDAGKVYPQARCSKTVYGKEIKEIIDWEPDIIHSHCEFTTFLLAKKIASKRNIPIVHTYHTLYEDYTHYIMKNRTFGKKIVSYLSKSILDKTQAVIVPTDKIKIVLERYQINSDTHVVPTGISLKCFNQQIPEWERRKMKEELGIKDGKKVLVTIGRLAKEKNTDFILNALKEMNRKDITLLIVGDGPYRQELEELTEELGIKEQTIFTGMIEPDKVHKYFQLGDIFVSASTSETQGLTYIEALASGLPSVCRKDLCIQGVIKDGINGFQFEDISSFKEYISKLIDDSDYMEQIRKNTKTSVQKYSTANYAMEVENLYYNTIQAYNRRMEQKTVFIFGNLLMGNKVG